MNYTEKLRLPQWVKSDRIRMEDFNDAMANIDSGISSADAKAESAQSTALSALDKVDSALSNLPFVVGSYEGLGNDPVYVELGFQPSFVIVSGMKATTTADSYDEFIRYFVMTSDNTNVRTRLQLTYRGLVAYRSPNSGTVYPNMNEAGRHYDYIAFK